MPFLGKTPTKLLDANVNIDGGNIDGTTIGATSAAAGTFTNLTATGTLTLPDDGISGDDVNGGTISNFASTGIDDNATSTAITIDSSQKVGIGTTSPAFGLSVESDNGSGYAALFRKSSSDPALTIQTTSSITQIQGLNSALNATNNIAMQLSGGNVGIGTASPYGELSIKSASPQLYLETVSNGNVQINFNETADQLDIMVNNSAGKIAFGTSSTERMRIDSSGHLLAGTANVNFGNATRKELRINGSAQSVITLSRADSTAASNNAFLQYAANELSVYTDTNGYIAFGNNGVGERMRIDSAGNVGIGSTSPTSGRALTLNNASNYYGIEFQVGGTSYGRIIQESTGNMYYDANTNMVFRTNTTTERMRIDSSGNVGIGTSSPFSTARLQVKTGTNLNLAIQTGTTETSGMKINAFNDAATANIPLELNGSVTLLKTGETERMRVDQYGNVSVRTTTGIGKLIGPRGNEVTVADDATVNLVINTAGACFIHAYDVGLGDGAVFFGTYKGGTTNIAAEGTHGWSTSDTDGNYCIYKSGNSHTITFKNRTGASRTMIFLVTAANTI